MKSHSASFFVAILSLSLSSISIAQQREPLCRTVRVLRLAHSSEPVRPNNDALAVITLRRPAPDTTRYVIAWREVHPVSAGGTVLRIARLSTSFQKIGPTQTMESEAMRADDGEGALSAANLPEGGMFVFRVQNTLQSVRVFVDGTAVRVLPLFANATEDATATTPRIVWTSMVERAANASVSPHIVTLVGYNDGSLRAFRIMPDGAITDDTTWTQRVGGSVRLLPTQANMPIVGLLERTLPGVGLNGDRPAIQMLVTLDERLAPVGTPERTGFAQFPWDVSTTRQGLLQIAQWVSGQGLAIARFSVTAQRVNLEVPRLWYLQPPLGGYNIATSAVTSNDGIGYSLVISQDSRAGLLEGHMSWIAPSGEPALRRNVLSLNGDLAARPRLLAAADGFVALVPVNDETGFAVEAHHVHCELVRRPEQ